MEIADAFAQAIEQLLQAENMRDVEIVVQSARRQGRSTELRVMIDRPGGIDLASCEFLAKGINTALRDFEDPYTLDVESAGLDRPLVKPTDYERFQGRLVCVKTHKLWEGAKTHRGRIDGLDHGAVRLVGTDGTVEIPLDHIKAANLEFDYRAALRNAEPKAPPVYARKAAAAQPEKKREKRER